MIPSLWRTLMPGVDLTDLEDRPYCHPRRERWFPTWRSAMIHALLSAQRYQVPYKVARDPEFGTWIAKPRNS
jgi:hypothetical protein